MRKSHTYTTQLTTKCQTVIPAPLRKLANIKKEDTLVWRLLQKKPWPVIALSPKPTIKDWSLYLSGLGKDVWEGVDTDKYLENIKKEWQN